jgi:hypothetical protein
MVLIGIVGKMGCGKDFIAKNIIIPWLNIYSPTCQLAFADQIKINTIVKQGYCFDEVFNNRTVETRTLLQLEGTEKGRDLYGEDIWIRYLDAWKELWHNRGVQNFVITDCRFANEIDYIKRNGGLVIKIIAPKRTIDRNRKESAFDKNPAEHKSETGIDILADSNYDLIINNDYYENTDSEKIIKQLSDLLVIKKGDIVLKS